MPAESSAPVKEPPKYKDITIQVRVHSASPFRLPRAGDFFWFANDKGRYIVPLLRALPQDPLKGFPAQGPMLIRNRSAHEILAVTVDDPADVYYYKNTDTLPVLARPSLSIRKPEKPLPAGRLTFSIFVILERVSIVWLCAEILPMGSAATAWRRYFRKASSMNISRRFCM